MSSVISMYKEWKFWSLSVLGVIYLLKIFCLSILVHLYISIFDAYTVHYLLFRVFFLIILIIISTLYLNNYIAFCMMKYTQNTTIYTTIYQGWSTFCEIWSTFSTITLRRSTSPKVGLWSTSQSSSTGWSPLTYIYITQ